MLNVTPQRSPEAAKSYFAKSDYLSEGQELVGNWGGKGAALLGLSGTVEKKAFDRLCDNLHPQTGRPLTPINRVRRENFWITLAGTPLISKAFFVLAME